MTLCDFSFAILHMLTPISPDVFKSSTKFKYVNYGKSTLMTTPKNNAKTNIIGTSSSNIRILRTAMTFAPEHIPMAVVVKHLWTILLPVLALLHYQAQSPQLSDLARKRKVCINPTPKGAKMSKGRNVSDPK